MAGFSRSRRITLPRLQISQGRLQPAPFLLYGQGGHIAGVGDDRQECQGRRHPEGLHPFRHLQVAYERGLVGQRQETIEVGREEVLPRQISQLRHALVQAQPDAEALAVRLGLVQAAAQACAHRAGERRGIKTLAEVPRIQGRRAALSLGERAQSSAAAKRAPQEIGQLVVAERQDELDDCLAGRRVDHARPVARGAAVDEEVEVDVGANRHGRTPLRSS